MHEHQPEQQHAHEVGRRRLRDKHQCLAARHPAVHPQDERAKQHEDREDPGRCLVRHQYDQCREQSCQQEPFAPAYSNHEGENACQHRQRHKRGVELEGEAFEEVGVEAYSEGGDEEKGGVRVKDGGCILAVFPGDGESPDHDQGCCRHEEGCDDLLQRCLIGQGNSRIDQSRKGIADVAAGLLPQEVAFHNAADVVFEPDMRPEQGADAKDIQGSQNKQTYDCPLADLWHILSPAVLHSSSLHPYTQVSNRSQQTCVPWCPRTLPVGAGFSFSPTSPIPSLSAPYTSRRLRPTNPRRTPAKTHQTADVSSDSPSRTPAKSPQS